MLVDAELWIHPLNIQACLHMPVCEYKREDSDFKDYTGQKGFIQILLKQN